MTRRLGRLGGTLAMAACLTMTGCSGSGSGSGAGAGSGAATTPPPAPAASGVPVALYDVTPGTCLPLAELKRRDGGDTNIVYSTVSCDATHAAEFFHVDEEFYINFHAAPIQNTENVQAAKDACWSALADYTGKPAAEAGVDSLIWAPGPNSWAAGERSLICLGYRLDDADGFVEWTGSLKAA